MGRGYRAAGGDVQSEEATSLGDPVTLGPLSLGSFSSVTASTPAYILRCPLDRSFDHTFKEALPAFLPLPKFQATMALGVFP